MSSTSLFSILGGVYSIYSIHIVFKDYEGLGMYVFAFKALRRTSSTSIGRYCSVY